MLILRDKFSLCAVGSRNRRRYREPPNKSDMQFFWANWPDNILRARYFIAAKLVSGQISKIIGFNFLFRLRICRSFFCQISHYKHPEIINICKKSFLVPILNRREAYR
jgi:hypothetical protein